MSDPFVGEMRLFGFPRIPSGWLPCIGQTVAISQYNALFAVIGTTYGGDGVSNFKLPDLRGRVPIGQGQGPNLPAYALGQAGGEDAHALAIAEIPQHSHALMSSTVTGNTAMPGNVHLATASAGTLYAPAVNAAPYAVMAQCIQPAGQSSPHNNIMPTVVGSYCIAYDGYFPTPG